MIESSKWSAQHLYDPGFIADDFKREDTWAIALVLIAIPVSLLFFVVVGLSVIQTVMFEILKHLTRGSIPAHIRKHIMSIGNAEQIIHDYKNPRDLEKLGKPIVFVLTKSKSISTSTERRTDGERTFDDDDYQHIEEHSLGKDIHH